MHASGTSLTHMHACTQDMTRLPYLNEPGVLWNLKTRYAFDDIYTYTGSILIAVNPFANLAHLYGSHMMDQYRGADFGDLSPHVYAVADSAYRQMRKENKGQSILVRESVCGEGGGGAKEREDEGDAGERHRWDIVERCGEQGSHEPTSHLSSDLRTADLPFSRSPKYFCVAVR